MRGISHTIAASRASLFKRNLRSVAKTDWLKYIGISGQKKGGHKFNLKLTFRTSPCNTAVVIVVYGIVNFYQ